MLGLALSPLLLFVLFREVDNMNEAASTLVFFLSVAACLGFSGTYHTLAWSRQYGM
jgi:predicted membrane channel-forming protein YqfA (hemolysin III family)